MNTLEKWFAGFFDGPYLQPMIDPVAMSLWVVDIRWYSLAYIAGLILALQFALWASRRTDNRVAPDVIDDFFVWVVIAMMLGGRLGYVLFYNLSYYLEKPIEILSFWQGGMSFHGAVLGIVLCVYIYCRRHKTSMLAFADLWVPAAPIGLLFGRLANFINGELYGRATDVPWAIVFINGGAVPRHPSQLYEALLEGVVLFIILNIAFWGYKAWRYRGVLSGLFLVLYGVMRTFVEQYREPDEQLGFVLDISGLGITMGQVLSSAMIIAGVALLVWGYGQKPYSPPQQKTV